ncbi:HlyD family secretion protein [Calothrix sp. NIES-4071]|nr:HlyD family secretion protein [Calothrix sp. NIES-4071]BAZ61782.1 HlyD family secretion protein [Calothrix sp. NIES-4105]
MPNPSRNPSPATIRERDNYQNSHLLPSAEPVETQTDTANDLFYGTEELLDALPQVWSRSVLYFLIGFSALVIPWSMLARVDEIGSARGRIEPFGATQKLDAEVSGSVKAVKIKEGDTVKAGQVLLELDSNILYAELKETEAKLAGLQNQKSQLGILAKQMELATNVTEQQNQSQSQEKISRINQAKRDLGIKQSTYNLQKIEKQSLVNQVHQQISTARNDEKSAQGRLKIDTQQVERFNQLVASGAVSAMQLDQLRKEQQESQRLHLKAQSDVKLAESRLSEEASRYQTTISQLESDIEQAKLRIQEEQNSYQSLLQNGKLAIIKNQQQLKDLQTQITQNQSQIAQTFSRIRALKLQMQQRVVQAPIDGTIFALPVSKPGAVVQPGQMVAEIAPKNVGFILKAKIPNSQSGFVKVGKKVKVKFDAYPFQDYGIVTGQVTWISPNSKIEQTPQGNLENYELQIALDKPYIQSGNKKIAITPGQTAAAEVIIRQRRIIDFVLDPFKKLQTNGLEL